LYSFAGSLAQAFSRLARVVIVTASPVSACGGAPVSSHPYHCSAARLHNAGRLFHNRILINQANPAIFLTLELLAKITFLQEAPKMEIAKLLWYKELLFY